MFYVPVSCAPRRAVTVCYMRTGRATSAVARTTSPPGPTLVTSAVGGSSDSHYPTTSAVGGGNHGNSVQTLVASNTNNSAYQKPKCRNLKCRNINVLVDNYTVHISPPPPQVCGGPPRPGVLCWPCPGQGRYRTGGQLLWFRTLLCQRISALL